MAQEVDLPAAVREDDPPASAAPAWRLRLGRSHVLHPSASIVQMAVGVIAAGILLVAFARFFNLSSAFQRLEHLSVALVILSGVVFLSAYVVRALRLRCLLAPNPVTVPQAVGIYQVAIFLNWLLPVRGGELVISLLLRRLHRTPISQSLPAVAMDKAMDLLPAAGLLALLPFLPFPLSRPLWILLLLVLVVLACGALFVGLAAWQRPMALALLSGLMGRFPASVRRRVEPFILRFVEALLGLVARPRVLLKAGMYTVVAVFLDALFAWLAFQAVGAVVAFPVVLYGFTFFNLGFILPSPPGQIGSNEVIGLLVFSGLFHINSSAVAAMFLFSHPWTGILMTTFGLISLSAVGLTLRSTLAMARSPAGPDTGS